MAPLTRLPVPEPEVEEADMDIAEVGRGANDGMGDVAPLL